jgi:hypothetical protein
MHTRLKLLAEKHNRSVDGEITTALQFWLDYCQRQPELPLDWKEGKKK